MLQRVLTGKFLRMKIQGAPVLTPHHASVRTTGIYLVVALLRWRNILVTINYRFPQQPRRTWMPAAQHAILGTQPFGAQGQKNVAAFFVRRRRKKNETLFSKFAFDKKKNWAPFFLMRRRQLFSRALFL